LLRCGQQTLSQKKKKKNADSNTNVPRCRCPVQITFEETSPAVQSNSESAQTKKRQRKQKKRCVTCTKHTYLSARRQLAILSVRGTVGIFVTQVDDEFYTTAFRNMRKRKTRICTNRDVTLLLIKLNRRFDSRTARVRVERDDRIGARRVLYVLRVVLHDVVLVFLQNHVDDLFARAHTHTNMSKC
jgi:hypothetical protein